MSRILPASCLLAVLAVASRAQVVAGHDFDPVSDAVVSWRIAPGRSVGQSMRAPASLLAGVRVKLLRQGQPADLEFRLGSRPGAADLAAGRFAAAGANPWFERWQQARFSPRRVTARTLYLELRLPASSAGSYEVFGTAQARLARPEFQVRFGYRPNWYDPGGEPAAFESAPNLDYGVRTPRYDAGAAFDDQRRPLDSMDLAFQLLGPQPVTPEGEERFAFVTEITGPLYPRRLREPGRRAQPGEVLVDGSWRLEGPPAPGVALDTAVREFREFLDRAMDVRLDSAPVHTITVAAGCGEPAAQPEAFHIRVAEARIEVCGRDEVGALRGLHFLEAEMKLRHAPLLALGETRLAPVHALRIAAGPLHAKSELDGPDHPYTDGLLGRMARAGFNSIWVWGDLDEIAHSRVFPELDHGVRTRQARLRQLQARAARYGMGVHVYLASRPLPEEFFQRHPETRGSALPAYGGVNILCSSVPAVRDHYRAALGDLFQAAPGLRGVSFIVGGEGFMHCYTRKNTCPRCSRRPPEETIAELAAAVFAGARAADPRAEVALWPYSASNTWSRHDITQARLIERLPPGLIFMTEFAKEAAISFGGITIPAYDYPLSIVGPAERFVRQSELAGRRGLGFWARTEHAIALEFVQTPYIPAMHQWAERFARVRAAPGVTGVFANWMHYGFMPTVAADLFAASLWDHAAAPDEILRRLAERDYGAEGAPHALAAWRAFSEAIREYPFSGSVALGIVQTGPAHPLFPSAGYRPVHGAGRQFRNDLGWTRPWGPELTLAQFRKLERRWSEGVAAMEQAVAAAPAALRPAARREANVARALLACVRSTIHVTEFLLLRERRDAAGGDEARHDWERQMARVARAELANAREAAPLVAADSRLGYANSGRNEQTGVARAGIYSAVMIEKKIAQVERLLRTELAGR